MKESKGPVVKTLPLCKHSKIIAKEKTKVVMDSSDASNASSADHQNPANVHAVHHL